MQRSQSGQTEYKPVTAHYHNNYAQTVHLTIAAPDGTTQTIVSNAIHPFLAQTDDSAKPPTAKGHDYQGAIPNAQWIAASDLRASYHLLGDDENWHTVQHVKTTSETLKAYNLTVADHHTYFIKGTEGTNGVWVHNDCWNSLPNNAASRHIDGQEVHSFTHDGRVVHVVENKNWVPHGNEPKYLEVNITNNQVIGVNNYNSNLLSIFDGTSTGMNLAGQRLNSLPGGNRVGNTKIFDSSGLSDKDPKNHVFNFAEEMGRGKLIPVGSKPGIWLIKTADGRTINVRSVSSSSLVDGSKPRWTIEVIGDKNISEKLGKPNLTRLEIKFK